MRIAKRDGREQEFDRNRIVRVIEKAMKETVEGIDHELSLSIAEQVEKRAKESFPVSVAKIQDLVEDVLMESGRKELAKVYILYRYEKDKNRSRIHKNRYRLLDDSFISWYKHAPSPLQQYGNFVYYRTYSRWLETENRREEWYETVRRAVEYNCSLVPTSQEEAQELFHNIFHLKQFLSGRTFWVGGTKVTDFYPTANYNCAFEIIENFRAFKDLFYLLMIGAGVGVRILKTDVLKLPPVRTDLDIINRIYHPIKKEEREENTSLHFIHGNTAEIVVGDSKEGWCDALEYFFKILTETGSGYTRIKTIVFNYDHVRGKGEKLKTFGGSSSGYESLKTMFLKIHKVIRKKQAALMTSTDKVKLLPIDCLDIVNIIGENVVVGGVRRTAEIILIDPEDDEGIRAKNELYRKVEETWTMNKEIAHRQLSNNSIYYTKQPKRERLHWQLEQMRYSGEPAWVNGEAGAKRRPNMNGVNPCAEILLDNKGLCNLTTVNVYAFVDQEGKLDKEALLRAQQLSARAGYRMTTMDLELPEWNNVQKRDRLLGCSLTGWQDMVNATGMEKEEQIQLLRQLRSTAKAEAKYYADTLGGAQPLLVTTIKPEGTLSQLPMVSSGIHYPHAPYYIRRVRINAADPLVKVCEELEYPVFPEVGETWENCTTKVIEFPIRSSLRQRTSGKNGQETSFPGKTKYSVTAIEQLELYRMFMENYVDHNCSITVHVRNHEWQEVEEWIWNHWDDVVAVSFLPLEDSFYKLLPYETISEEEYQHRVSAMKPFLPHLLRKYEKQESDFDPGSDGCESGICPIR